MPARDEQESLCLSIGLHARKLGASTPAVRFKVKFSKTKAVLQLVRDIVILSWAIMCKAPSLGLRFCGGG